MKVLGIIPARYASTRFPGKPLVVIDGKSMIQRVYEQASKSKLLDKVIVATDDKRIYNHVVDFGGKATMTSAAHQSGTDRCAEVAAAFQEFHVIINIQGDEPFIHPEQIDRVVALFQQNKHCQIATLLKIIDNEKDLFSPDVVKAVVNTNGEAMYFSRHPIPFVRDEKTENWLHPMRHFYRHLGIYGFTRAVLLQISALPPGQLENAEKLEQLRWLEAGFSISTGITTLDSKGIDRPEDIPLS